MKVYVVKMNRMGDPEKHSYLIGVYTKKHQAKKAALAEEFYRGGKYTADIWLMELNKQDQKAIDYLNNSCGGYDDAKTINMKFTIVG